MTRTIPLVLVLSVFVASGCGGEGAEELGESSSDLMTITQHERFPDGTIFFDVGDVCLSLVPSIPSSNVSPWNIDYDARGRVIMSEFDLDGDGAGDAACSFAYESGQITVALDLGMDGEADAWGTIGRDGRLGEAHLVLGD